MDLADLLCTSESMREGVSVEMAKRWCDDRRLKEDMR